MFSGLLEQLHKSMPCQHISRHFLCKTAPRYYDKKCTAVKIAQNRKVSDNNKLITRQHSYIRAWGVVNPANLCFSSLIIVQNLVTVSHSVCAHVGSLTNFADAGSCYSAFHPSGVGK